MNKKISFKKNFSWAFFGNAFFSASQWLLLIILAKLGSPIIVGTYTLGLAVVSPIIIFSQMQLRQVQVSDVKNNYNFKTYLNTRIITNGFALILILSVSYLSGYNMGIILIIMLIGILKTIDGISDIYYGYYQKKERMDLISKSRILKGILNVISFLIVLNYTNSLLYSVLTMVLFNLSVLIFYDHFNSRKHNLYSKKHKFKIIEFKNLIWLSLPLGIVLMLTSLSSNVPRYFIEANYGLESLGYYSSIAYLMVIGTTFVTALGQVAAPRLAKYYADNRIKDFISLTKKFSFISLILGILGIVTTILFGETILKYAYTEEYMKYNNVFIVLMIAAAINYVGSIWGYCLTAAREFKIQPVLGAFWLITVLLFSFILIPKYGLLGAAYAQIITSLTQLLSKIIVVYIVINNRKGSDFLENPKES